MAILVSSFVANFALMYSHKGQMPLQDVVGLLVHIGSYGIVIVLGEMIRKRAALLQESLAEKVVILGDVHHRMKNQMVAMLSFIELSDKTEPAKAFEALKGRLMTYFNLYDKLCYDDKADGTIELGSYLADIIRDNIDSKGDDKCEIAFRSTSPDLYLRNNDAISVGLIVNELATNSLKYAFKKRSSGTISLSIRPLDPTRGFLMTYSDDGCGFVFNPKAEYHKMGNIMVDSLTRQLQGSVNHSNVGGSNFAFKFDKIAVAKAHE